MLMMWGGLILPCSHLTTRLEGVTITDKTLFKHSQSKHKHNIVFKNGEKMKKNSSVEDAGRAFCFR